MCGKTALVWRAFGLLAALAAVVGREEDGDPALQESKGSQSVVSWGLVDATATPGRLFEYSLPRTTREGQPTKYTVFEAGSDRLPKWLSFDSRRNILEGVPASGDGDRLHYMEVSAENIFGGKEETFSKDVFVIDVRKEVVGTSAARPLGDRLHGDRLHGNATIICAPGDAVTMATVTLDADFDAMSGSTRAKLVRDFGRHVGLSVTSLTMTSSGGDDDDRLNNIPLVAGPGNVVSPKHPNGRVLLVQWVVGCGSVTAGNMRILEHLEATAVNGSLTEDTGSGVIGWHVTRSKIPRRKRLVSPPLHHHPTATPLQTRGLPVGRPTATRVVSPTDGRPEVRVFPSAVFPGASVTSERPHRSKSRHHHRDKTKHGKQTSKPSSRGDKNDPGFKTSLRPTPEIQVTDYPNVLDTRKHPDFLEPSLAFPVAGVVTAPTKRLSSSARMQTTMKMKKSSSPSDRGKPLGIPGEGVTLPGNTLPPIWRFSVLVGEVFKYAIPNESFHRHEVQELVLVTLDGSSRSWIKVDQDAWTLYGLPLEGDVGGVVRYALEGRDSSGKIVERCEVEITVRRNLGNREVKVNHEVKVELAADYHRFMGDVDQRIDVATRIAHAHGDRDAADVTVTRILEGSVEFFWSNRSLLADPCPVDALRRMADRMIRTEDDGLLDPDFARAMEPHEVRSVEFAPRGACASRVEVRTGNRKEDVEEEVESDPDPGLAKSVDGLLLTTVVPILILVVVFLLVLIVVCAVCARRKKNKNRKEEEVKERGGWDSASRKGVPVIFADELEDTPGSVAAPSRVLTGERRPMIADASPDYDRPSTAGHSPSSPSLVPGRNSPPGYDNGANRSTTGTATSTGTPHHRRVASGGTRAQQVSRDPPPYGSS